MGKGGRVGVGYTSFCWIRDVFPEPQRYQRCWIRDVFPQPQRYQRCWDPVSKSHLKSGFWATSILAQKECDVMMCLMCLTCRCAQAARRQSGAVRTAPVMHRRTHISPQLSAVRTAPVNQIRKWGLRFFILDSRRVLVWDPRYQRCWDPIANPISNLDVAPF